MLRQQTATSAAGFQALSPVHTMLGMNGDNPWTDDGADIMKRVDTAIDTTNPGIADPTLRAVVTGSLLETQISNVGVNTAYIDMYYWRCKRNVPVAAAGHIGTLFQRSVEALSTAVVQLPAGNTMDFLDYGVTPFQGTEFAKYVTIWKKTRVKLSPGSVTQVETRNGKDTVINWDYDRNHSMRAGVTQGILFIFYGAASDAEGETISSAASLQFSTNANYTWRIIENARKYGDVEET